MTHLPYRPCVGIMLLNREGKAFVGRRIGVPESIDRYAWQMPQGGIDGEELPEQAARRELLEETGISSVALLAEAPEWYAYDLPDEFRQGWKRKWRGQTQKWFAYRFTGTENEINIAAPHAGAKPEFDQWRWAERDELPTLVVPFKRGVYESVVSAFRTLGPG